MSTKIFYVVLAIILVALSIFIYSRKSKSTITPTTTASLSSLSVGPAPWQPEYKNLGSRLKAINLPLLGEEGTALHIHIHLDIFIDNKRVTVPTDIGIPTSGGVTPIHTHDTTGIIHIESPDAHASYTLNQFIDIWGVKLTDTSIGGYNDNGSQKLIVYSNGNEISDPVNLPLIAHQEITITYGTTQQKPTIAKSYQFPQGL